MSASTRTLPVWISGSAICVPTNIMSMRPARTSVMTSDTPLYWTATMSVPLIDFITSAGMWLAVPIPAEP